MSKTTSKSQGSTHSSGDEELTVPMPYKVNPGINPPTYYYQPTCDGAGRYYRVRVFTATPDPGPGAAIQIPFADLPTGMTPAPPGSPENWQIQGQGVVDGSPPLDPTGLLWYSFSHFLVFGAPFLHRVFNAPALLPGPSGTYVTQIPSGWATRDRYYIKLSGVPSSSGITVPAGNVFDFQGFTLTTMGGLRAYLQQPNA